MQRRHVITAAVVVVLGWTSASFAQQTMPADFLKARQERNDSLDKGDKATYERLTASGFVVTDPTGRVENRAERVARVVPPQNPPTPAPRLNETMTMYNNDTIVLRWSTAVGGGQMHFTETWVKEGGQWKCAAAHLSRVAPAGGGGREGGRGN
jgi:hypothetical protein